jgi:hypothetical protein
MPSEEAKRIALGILRESGEKYGKQYLVVEDYDPKAVDILLDSMIDMLTRARVVIKEDKFSTPVDAIDFCGMITEVIMHSASRNLDSLAMLKRIVRSKEYKKN